MATGNASPSNNKQQPQQPQAQTPQIIEWEKFIDIGMCVLVCDWKVKPLLEHMLAHEFFEMPAYEVARLAEKLPEHMHGDKRKRLSEKLKKPDLGKMKAKKLREYIRHTLRWSLYELQCVVEALGKDSDRLVEKLRETRDSLVDKYRKFKDKSERDTFLETYDKFINNFDFKKYFNSSRNTKREECLQLSLDYTGLVKMLSEYDKTKKMLSKEIADWEERYKKHLEALKVERNQLKGQVGTLEEQLEGEKAKRKPLEAELVDKQQKLSDKDKKIERLEQQLAEITEQLRKTEEKLQSERDASKTEDQTIGKLEEKKADMEHDVSETDDTITELSQKLVNNERERIILQNYCDSQTGGKAGLTGFSMQVSGKLTISRHSSLTTSLALFGVKTDGWKQFHDIGLCVIAFDCKLKSLFELLLATSITTDNAIQVLFDSDDDNNLKKALWHSKPKTEKQLKYLEKVLTCIDDGFPLHGCTREELIFLINAVNEALTKFIEIKQVNLSEFNRLRKKIRKLRETSPRDEAREMPLPDEGCETSLLDEKRGMLSDLLKKLLNTDLRIEVFRTALMLHFVQQRNLNAERLHNRLREVSPADLFKDADQLFKDADTLRNMRNDIVHREFRFPEDEMRNKFLEAYRHVIDQMEFGNIYPLSDAEEVKEAYLLPNVTWGEMTDVAVKYESAKQQHCIKLKQELKDKESQIQKDVEKIQKQEKQIQEQEEQIRKLEKESWGMTRVHEQNFLNFVQVIEYTRFNRLGMEPGAFIHGLNQGLPCDGKLTIFLLLLST